MRLSTKERILLIPATLLALAGLRIDDHIYVGLCFGGSWLSFVVLFWIHQGARRWRILSAVAVSGLFVLFAWRVFAKPSTPEVRVGFKSSPLFTDKRKNAITHEMTEFHDYLVAFGFDPPIDVPPVAAINAGSPMSPGWGESMTVDEKSLDNPAAIYNVYAGETFSVAFKVEQFGMGILDAHNR